MTEIDEYNGYGDVLETLLRLQTSPIAVKMLESEADIPQEAFRPKKDRNEHYAQCQAFSLSRRNRATVAMLKEDNWCPAPPVAYGLVRRPDGINSGANPQYDRFELGKYIGILTAPLKTAVFEPDAVIIYCDTNQLRNMLLSLKEEEKPKVKSNFFPFSCAYSVTSPILKNEYWINLPDPGEHVRALTQAGEMMFTVPKMKLIVFMNDLKKFFNESMYANEPMIMKSDFPQPDLYKKMFKAWGMGYEESEGG